MDGVASDKLVPTNIGEFLPNHEGEIMFMFPKHVGVRGSNEAELLAILEALCIFSSSFHEHLIVENHSLNTISWENLIESFNCIFSTETKSPASSVQVESFVT